MNDQPLPPEEPASRQIGEAPIPTYQPRFGSRVQMVTGFPLLLSWVSGWSGHAWPWQPVVVPVPDGWARAALAACGVLLMATFRSGPRLRMVVLALTAFAGLWFTGGTLWAPVPDWYVGGRWADHAPHWCYLLTPAFALLVGGVLGAGNDAWSRLRLSGLAMSATVILGFYIWPVRGVAMYEVLTDVCREGLRDSLILGCGLIVLFASGFALALASLVAALQRRISPRAGTTLIRILLVFVLALSVNRLAFASQAVEGSLLRSFLLPILAGGLLFRELALGSALALLVALWLDHHERRRPTGWAQAF